MMPMKKPKSGETSALDSLMDGGAEETPGAEMAEAAPKPAAPKGDPATVIASIQSQLDELSSLLSMG